MRRHLFRRDVRIWIAVLRHAVLLWRTGLLRFRLETFGVYVPALPYTAPAWKLSPRYVALLARQSRSYGRWLLELDAIRRDGADGWWGQRPTRPNDSFHEWS